MTEAELFAQLNNAINTLVLASFLTGAFLGFLLSMTIKIVKAANSQGEEDAISQKTS